MSRDPGLAFTDGSQQFHAWSQALWDPAAGTLVEAAELRDGQVVLDACCGAGAATLPAARAVGPAGTVDGVDLSSGLLALAGKRLAEAQLLNTTLTEADVTAWRGHRSYDAVLCSYSLFFFEPMDRGAGHLISLLRPGGRFVVNTWARDALSPLAETILAAAVAERPRLAGVVPAPNYNMSLIDQPEAFSRWLGERGLQNIQVTALRNRLTVDPEMAWTLVLGSGWRTLLPRDPEAMVRVRRTFLDRLREHGELTELNSDTLLATGQRP
ncbi:methyltransferase domain-containing protein [Acaricomes phytoseiuli]|uniref:class I SAM-dependent methyltransferase n=1 Tax=Acaricomes phytoseiuli TaxID=291968 RepID=UPI00036E93B0|nr:class I SAM-dependent methyltransferase [Acaricomes phytoseiuli]MCW1250410.1 methyltransferase domain-containing protein [Acaricomes phytoseiuli]